MGDEHARRRFLAVVVIIVITTVAAGCSGDDGSTGSEDAAATTTTAPGRADMDLGQVELQPMPEGAGTPEATDDALPEGYQETEYVLSGVAGTYDGAPNEPATPTGDELDYATRLLVRAPTDPGDFSGRVLVEPFNTSGGADADVVWRMVGPLLSDSGDAWVGVTVRTNSVTLLQDFDAERYADLDVPANDVAWDVLRQVGGLLKEGGDSSPLGDARADHLYLGGYSQSGLDVASFLGAIAGDTQMEDGSPVYDGFLPAARSGSLTPLQSGTAFIPTFVYDSMGPADVPVVDIESQSDVQGFTAPALAGETYTSPGGAGFRLDDSDTYRLYEVAGMSHAGGATGSCEGPPTDFPNAPFVRAATDLLFQWTEEGTVPPEVDPLETASEEGRVWTIAVDDVGNPLGGVRSPFVDVPLAQYVASSEPGAVCKLFGRAIPLDAETVASRYDSADDYLEQFTASLDATIEAGFLLDADRDELLDLADDQAQAAFA